MKLISLFSVGLIMSFSFLYGQCTNCGNGVADAGETAISCPSDFPVSPTCTASTSLANGIGTTTGIRESVDFASSSTTLSATGLPSGWSFSTLANDAYGAKQGIVTPTGATGNRICQITSNLGADFDGRPNSSSHPSFVVLRGTGSPFLASPTYNMSNVDGFKIQFWLSGSTSACGGTFSGCSSAKVYLDFSSNGGTTWTQILQMTSGGTSSNQADMCTSTTNNVWFKDGGWSRVCLTVFKSTTSSGNYYPAANANTAQTGMMVNASYFVSNFKYRIRYELTGTSCGTISATNPGRYIAIDYPVITSGNQLIPCGLSFINSCGYGLDDNNDGVGSSTATTMETAFGTIKRGVNNSEKGVEILTSQNALFAATNANGSNYGTDYQFGNAEGGDRQCINWQTSSGNSIAVAYEVLMDFKPSSGGVKLFYYKNGAAQSVDMTYVSGTGKTPAIGYRYGAIRYVNCSGSGGQDLNPGCNGYNFATSSLPTAFGRAFYNLNISNNGLARSIYGSTSCSNYFNGPTFAPISSPIEVEPNSQFVECDGNGVVFRADVDFCSPTFIGADATYIVTGPNGFYEEIVAGETSSVLTVAGEYTIIAQAPDTPKQCLDCGRRVCVTISESQLDGCVVVLNDNDLHLRVDDIANNAILYWKQTSDAPTTSHFTIEKTSDGVYYDEIGVVEMEILSKKNGSFQFTDKNPLFGESYYRVTEYDVDGKKTNMAVVKFVRANNSIAILPNPTTGKFSIAGLSGPSSVVVTDMQGKVIVERDEVVLNSELTIDAPSGVYFVTINSPTLNTVVKLIKE